MRRGPSGYSLLPLEHRRIVVVRELRNLDSESFTGIIEDLFDGLYMVDRDRKVTYWNPAAERISGFGADEVIGRCCSDNLLTHVDDSGRCHCHGRCPFEATMKESRPRELEMILRHKDGHRIPVLTRVSPLTDRYGKVLGAVELFTDLTGQRATAQRIQELERIALLDGLTRLANRHYLEREIQRRFAELSRFGLSFGLLFFDIDHFKRFNDAHGHVLGDRVLQFVAKILVTNSRPFDLIGRWGGDELVGVINAASEEVLTDLGERLRALVEQSYLLDGQERLQVTVSIGATLARKGESEESLLKRADALLYESKRRGRDRLTLG